jgi:hypothetical protein
MGVELFQFWKEPVNQFQIPHPPFPVSPRDKDILPDREIGKDAPVIRNKPYPHLSNFVRRFPDYIGTFKFDLSGSGRGEAYDASQGGRFARSVPSEQANGLSFLYLKGNAKKDVACPVIGVHLFHLEYHAAPPK